MPALEVRFSAAANQRLAQKKTMPRAEQGMVLSRNLLGMMTSRTAVGGDRSRTDNSRAH